MKRISSWLLAGVLACASCQSDNVQAPAAPETGVTGTVYRGPMEPVVHRGDNALAETFAATFHVYRDLGEVTEHVADFHTGPDGKFALELEPGEYNIVPDASAPILYPESQVKTLGVPEGRAVTVRLDYDTGIR